MPTSRFCHADFIAAVEPLCLTLGFLSGGRKTNNEEKKTNA